MWDNYGMTKAPETIKVGDAVYVVAPLLESEEQDGEFCVTSATIRVRKDVAASYAKCLLAHELVHAMFEHAGAVTGKPNERFTEEQVACIIGRMLPLLLQQNPTLVEYLTHG